MHRAAIRNFLEAHSLFVGEIALEVNFPFDDIYARIGVAIAVFAISGVNFIGVQTYS